MIDFKRPAPPPPPPVAPLAAKLTVFTSQAPETITKVYALIDGELSQVEGEHMREGMANTVEVKNAAQFVSLLKTLKHNQALSYGLTGHESIKTFSENEYLKRGTPAGAITRTKENMNWSNGAGLMLLDYDPRDGAPALTSDELQAALAAISPEFKTCARAWWCSASSHIYHGDKELRGLRGQRVYPFVKDARDIPRAGKVLFKRLWLAGYGYIKIHKNGTTGARTIIDGEVWQTNRIDYASGAKCLNGLDQRRGDPVAVEGKLLDTTAALPDLSPAEEELYQMLVKVETLKVKAEVDAIRNTYEAAKAHSDVVTSGKKPTPENIAQARAVVSEALDNKTLRGEFRIILASGDSVTVNEILDNPAFYHSAETLDPIEPDYDGGRVVGKLYVAEGAPNLHSFARGENTYLLKRGFGAAPTHLYDGTPISQVPLTPPPPATTPVAPAVPVELSGWRDPVDLFSNTPVPPFPMECVPPAVRNYAEAISKASGFDVGAYAFSALITAAGHIKHSHRVQINDSYSQGAVLWGGVCDPSGGGKSAIMSASIAPLMAIDKQLAKQGMFKLSEWQANLEQAKKNGEPVPPRPVWQQRIISDTTTEAAGALLEGNDGLLLHADEITEFVGRMDAYSGASGKDRGVWLKSYDGEAVTINRAGRMPVHIPHFSVGIIAGMQPETLARLFNKSGGGAGSDGLFQRFLLYQVRQAIDADFSVVVGEPIKQSYNQLFSLIEGWNNSGFSANATVLDRDAVAAHQEYVNNVRKITARTSSPRFKEHLSKFQAFVIRLALVLHCLECAGRGQYSTQLTLETYNRAKQIMAVLYRHSEAAYLVLDDTLPVTHDLMKSAAEAILSKKFAVVKMGDLTRDATGWRAADGRLKQAAIDGLLELDWLKDITPDHTGRGRPSLGLFAVNPKVSVLFSNQAERITRERAERYETIKEIAAAR